MADNVAITSGVGTSVATDDVSGVQFQKVKLDVGGDGVTSPLSATAGLPVQAGPAASPVYVSTGLKITEQLTRAVISCAASGDNTIVAASASNFFRLYAILFTVATPVGVKLGDTSFYTGVMTFGLGGGLLLAQQGEPWFISSATNKAFIINLSAAVQCSGTVWYTLAP